MEKGYSGFEVSNGANIFYRRVGGQGETLVFLHGNGEDSSIFNKQIPFFAEKYQVLAIDSRGHGKSSLGLSKKENLTLKMMAEDVSVVLELLQITNAHIVGYSDGGNIALIFALLFPGRVKSLVLAGANLSPLGVKKAFQLPVYIEYFFYAFASFFSTKADHRKKLLSLMAWEPRIASKELSAISVPALILAGERDVIKEKHTRLIASTIRNAKLSIIKGAGHFIFGEQAEKVNEEILEFLKGVEEDGL